MAALHANTVFIVGRHVLLSIRGQYPAIALSVALFVAGPALGHVTLLRGAFPVGVARLQTPEAHKLRAFIGSVIAHAEYAESAEGLGTGLFEVPRSIRSGCNT